MRARCVFLVQMQLAKTSVQLAAGAFLIPYDQINEQHDITNFHGTDFECCFSILPENSSVEYTYIHTRIHIFIYPRIKWGWLDIWQHNSAKLIKNYFWALQKIQTPKSPKYISLYTYFLRLLVFEFLTNSRW